MKNLLLLIFMVIFLYDCDYTDNFSETKYCSTPSDMKCIDNVIYRCYLNEWELFEDCNNNGLHCSEPKKISLRYNVTLYMCE